MININIKNKLDNRPIDSSRTLKRGDIREDGKVFWAYAKTSKTGEFWVSKEKFYEKTNKAKENNKLWYRDNPTFSKKKYLKRRKDPIQKILDSQRNRLRYIVKQIKQSDSLIDLIGCTANELRNHIESKFSEGMNWSNYGYDGWHIDHIRPCASFDLSDPIELKKCFNFLNLQPLWADENRSKGSKYKSKKKGN
jgi:hypothetical protein